MPSPHRLLLLVAAAVLASELGCGSRSALNERIQADAPGGSPSYASGGHRLRPLGSGGEMPWGSGGMAPAFFSGGTASLSGGGGPTGGALPSLGGTRSTGGSAGGSFATSGGAEALGGGASGGQLQLPPPRSTGKMTATTAGIYLVVTSPIEAWIYRFAFDRSLISSWALATPVTQVSGILNLGTDIYISGTEINQDSGSNLPHAFLKKYSGEGSLVWTRTIDPEFYASSAPLATDGVDILLLSSPVEPKHCEDDMLYGVSVTFCSPPSNEELAPHLLRVSSEGKVVRSSLLDPLARRPNDFTVGPNGHLYLGSYSSGAALPYAEFDAFGALIADSTQNDGDLVGSLELRRLTFDREGALYLLTSASSPSTHFGDYPLMKIPRDAPPIRYIRPFDGAYYSVNDFVAASEGLFFVGDRQPPPDARPHGLLVQTDFDGHLIYEAPADAFSNSVFSAVAEAPDGQVYMGGHSTPEDGAVTEVFVGAWPKPLKKLR